MIDGYQEFAGLTPRPDQLQMLQKIVDAVDAGYQRICVEGKTGFGKSLVQMLLSDYFLRLGKTVAQTTPRITLTNAMIGWAETAQIPFGVRHKDYPEYDNPSAGLQICSLMTELSRGRSIREEDLEADVIIVDETHINLSPTSQTTAMLANCAKNGSVIIGFSATPLEIDHFYELLITGPTYRELWDRNVLVPARYYDGGFPALDTIKGMRNSDGEYNKKLLRKFKYTQQIFGSIFTNYFAQNPDIRPWFVFANGVDESRWICDEFNRRGVRAAHVDGSYVYENGKEIQSKQRRFEIIEEMNSEDSRVKVLCGRFVLREGVDVPRLYGMSLATPIGSLKSMIQICGRGARFHESKEFYKLLDHGGNRHRHGSPNEERDWQEMWTMKATAIEQLRCHRVRLGKSEPGHACKECGMVWAKLPKGFRCECGNDLRRTFECPRCQHAHYRYPQDCCCEKCGQSLRKIRVKPVIQSDGSLRYVSDECMALPETRKCDKSAEMWKSRFFGAFRKKEPDLSVSLSSLKAWVNKKHLERYYVRIPDDLPLMPVDPADWYKPIRGLRWCDLRDEAGEPMPSRELCHESFAKKSQQKQKEFEPR